MIWAERLSKILIASTLLLLLVYACDFVILRLRVSRGTAFATVEVDQFLATSLKGNKTEYDVVGTTQVTCSRSLFPQKGNLACWWLERHKAQWEQ